MDIYEDIDDPTTATMAILSRAQVVSQHLPHLDSMESLSNLLPVSISSGERAHRLRDCGFVIKVMLDLDLEVMTAVTMGTRSTRCRLFNAFGSGPSQCLCPAVSQI